ncbi:MAG: thioredoxin family protein [Deltaproteobacteria bacterium]|jgi:thioredoxin-related protein|nr:thioredoxin family protein [Deltaproteobacteria bacterium]
MPIWFRLFWAFAVLLALSLDQNPLLAQSAPPPSLTSVTFPEALKEAAKNNKTILVYFWADWCPSCQYFNSTVAPNPEVQKSLRESFTVVTINTSQETHELTDRFEIRAIPAFVFLNSQGQPITMLPGAVEPQIFILVLKYLSSGSYATMEFEDFAKLSSF